MCRNGTKVIFPKIRPLRSGRAGLCRQRFLLNWKLELRLNLLQRVRSSGLRRILDGDDKSKGERKAEERATQRPTATGPIHPERRLSTGVHLSRARYISLVRLEGFEPPTLGSVDRCSNPLSYSRLLLAHYPSGPRIWHLVEY